MSSSSSTIVRSAIERAESRASVLNSLEKAYGTVTQQKVLSKKVSSPSGGEKPPVNNGVRPVQIIQNFTGDQRERTRKALLDSLTGKSIVLTNLKSQTDASKSAKRVKSALCKLTSQRASKSKLKRLPSALCDPMIAPSLADIDTLNSLWCIYIASVMSGAQSDAQLQARLMTSEMVGARVIVAESGTEKCKGRDKGLKGIVTAVSKQSYYITYQKRVIDTSSSSSSPVSSSAVLQTPAPDTATQSDLCAASTSDFQEIIVQSNPEEVCNDNSKSAGAANREWKEVVWTDKMVVRRLLKSTCILAVLLPPPVKKARKSMDGISINSSEGDSGRICLLHGRELMQYSIPP